MHLYSTHHILSDDLQMLKVHLLHIVLERYRRTLLFHINEMFGIQHDLLLYFHVEQAWLVLSMMLW